MSEDQIKARSLDSKECSQLLLSDKTRKFASEKQRAIHEFKPHLRNTNWRSWSYNENSKDLYAVLPPIDKFMDVGKKESWRYLWDGFQRGDVVVARISSIRDHGFSALLVSLDGGKSKYISQHKIHAWCPVSEIPKQTNHEDVLLQFSCGDIVRCIIVEVHSAEAELVVSMQKRPGSPYNPYLGKIEDDDLPLACRRSLATDESYQNILVKSIGFMNPSSINYLTSRLKIPKGPELSLMSDLRAKSIPQSEYAEHLRKIQSRKVANASVKKGIERFKNKEYEIALQEFNYALDMDTENVDALVARGALYANRNCFTRAIRDFEVALKLQSDHRNAKKYLIEVLVERAKQIESQMEDVEQVKEVKRCYQRVLSLDSKCEEARRALGQIEENQQKSKVTDSSSGSSEDDYSEEKYADTARKLKHILKHDAGIRKRSISQTRRKRSRGRKDSTSSSSSSSSSSASSSTSKSSDGDHQKKKLSIERSSTPPEKISDTYRKADRKDYKTKAFDNVPQKRQKYSFSKSRSSRKSSSSSNSSTTRHVGDSDWRRKTSSSKVHYRRNSSSSGVGRYVEEPPLAVIQSSQHRTMSTEATSSQSSKVRRKSADIRNITKDNFENILHEISRFESTNRH